MTGIERLRELAGGINCSVWACSDNFYCEAHDLTPYNNGGMMRVALEDIADQIEREQDKVAMTDWEAVREVCDDMARHVSGIPEFDDLVDRWCRTLDGALDGRAGSVHDTAKDREAIAWVREHGGLDQVKIDYDVYEGFSGLVDRIAARLGVSVEGLDDQDAEPIVTSALDRRLMPEGMDWPTVDGKPVVIGERMRSCGIDDCKVVGIDPGNSRLILASDNIEEGKATYFTDFAEYCHRPTPKVLDADGAEIRVGDHVWNEVGTAFTAIAVDGKNKSFKAMRHFDGQECEGLNPAIFTHRAPVLAADGRPLHEGETVYLIYSPTAFVVDDIMTREDGATVVHLKDGAWHLPQYLTHERPESWDRLEEDAEKDPCGYFGFDGEEICGKCPASGKNCEQTMARDIVRRCRALAERERGEWCASTARAASPSKSVTTRA